MFTSSIKSKSFFNGEFKVEVEFSNGTQTWTETFLVRSKNNLNNAILQRLKELNDLLAYNTELTTGAFAPTEPSVVTPTQAETERERWFRNFNRLQQLTKLNELGALRANAVAGLDTLRATVSADFKQAYVADM